MKQHLILLTIFSLILVSCKNGNGKETKTQYLETEVPEKKNEKLETNKTAVKETQEKSFNWSKSKALKQKFLSALKESDLPQDKIVVDYLNAYVELANEFNDILFKKSNYDSLNTLVYLNKDKIYQCALDFKTQVETSGFSISSSEGMIYIEQNTTFIKSESTELLDSVSVEFLNNYCLEVDAICCEDAGVIISEKELINRVLNWGNLIEKANGTKYLEIAKTEFYSNLSLLYMGLDNTPSFDWTTGKFNKNSFDYMKKVIEQFPNSKAAKEFKEFSDLIVSEDFERTEKVIEFFNKKFK